MFVLLCHKTEDCNFYEDVYVETFGSFDVCYDRLVEISQKDIWENYECKLDKMHNLFKAYDCFNHYLYEIVEISY